MLVKAEGTNNPERVAELSTGWNNVTVDLSASGAWSASQSYTGVSIFPGFSCDLADASTGSGNTYFVDNVLLNVKSAPAASASPSASASSGSGDTTSTITFDGSTYDSLATAYGCDWWTSANNAKADGTNSTGNALQCSHPGTAGVRLTATSGMSFTSSSSPSVTFNVYALDDPATIKVRIVAEGVAAPEVSLNIPAGWSSQTVDFSTATGYSSSASYTRLDIEGSGAAHFWVDNLGLLISTGGASASPTTTAAPAPTVASIKLDAADFGPAGVASVGNGWWNEGNGSNSVVKYTAAGGTLTLHYTVKDSDGNAVSGAQVSLQTTGSADAKMTGDRTKSTDADGKVTFTFTNSNTNADAEWPRPDSNVWSDSETSNVDFNVIPYISGSSRTTECYSAANATACTRDRIWAHVVSTATYTTLPKTTIRLVDGDKLGMTDKSSWWTDTAANHSMVKFVTAGNKLVLHYQVSEGGTPVGAGRTVTLAKNIVTPGSDYTGSLTATTDSRGIATFVLTNTNTSGENRPVAPSSMTYWDDSRDQGTNTEVQFSPSVSPLNTAVANYDRVWTHIVNKPDSQGVPAAPYLVAAKRSGAKQITVSWNAATEDGNANTGYEVTLTPKTGTAVVATASPAATSLAVNVSVVTSYTASVKAINSAGKSVAKAAIAAVTPSSLAAKVPNAPVMGTSPIRGVNALWLPFSPSGVDSGATASGFQYTIDNGVNWQDVTYDPAKSGNILFLYNLPSGKSYSVKVRALNSVGVGLASVAKTTSTAVAPTGKPTLTTVSYVGTTLTIGFSGIATASNGGSAITGYDYSLNNGTNWIPVTKAQWDANKIVITGLDASLAPFTVTMRGKNGLNGPAATAKVVRTITSTPTFTLLADYGKVKLTITALTAAANTSNSPVVKYQYTKNNGETWIDTASGITYITATKGTAVSVKVRAVNSVGAGTASLAKSATAK